MDSGKVWQHVIDYLIMIWTSQHLQNICFTKSTSLLESSKPTSQLPLREEDATYVAIIGGGPKGFYALERLIAHLRKADLSTKTIIHWYNTNASFGAGQNYAVNQPDYLLINYCIGKINCWEDQDNLKFVNESHNLTDWINENKTHPNEANDEDFASRELVGHYLMNAVYDLLQYEITQVEIHLVNGSIDDLNEHNKKFTLYEQGNRLPFDYTSILLATGHCYSNESAELSDHAENSSFNYYPYAYPIQQLDAIPSKSSVAIKGIGLTFIDVILQLTEGRGGKFVDDQVELTYLPSGDECILYPFSRCNLPMMPRSAILPHTKYKLKYMTDKWVQTLKNSKQQIDFHKDILPIYQKEFQYAYYKSLENQTNTESQASDKMQKGPENSLTLDQFIHPNTYVFSPEKENYQDYMTNLSGYVLKEIAHGELSNKIAAAAGAIREGLIQIGKLFHFDGFDPQSHKDFILNWYSSLSRMSYGPPLINGKKLHALMKAGIVQFSFHHTPTIRLFNEGLFLSDGHQTIHCGALIDARIPRGSIKKGNNPLYKNLYKKSIIQERFNGSYATDAIAINQEGKLKNKSDWRLTLYGTPTEGNVLDNDSLSRKAHNFGNIWAQETADFLISKSK